MKYAPLFLVCLSISACNQPSEELTSESEPNGVEENYFPGFPKAPFFNLTFDELISESETKVKEQGFTQNEENKVEWISNDKNTRIVFSEGINLGEFKVYFTDKKDDFLQKTLDLFQKSSKNGSKQDKSANYWYFEIKAESVNYTITLFTFDDLLRLNYKLKQSH